MLRVGRVLCDVELLQCIGISNHYYGHAKDKCSTEWRHELYTETVLDISEERQSVRVFVTLPAQTKEVSKLGEIWAEFDPLSGVEHPLTLVSNNSVEAVNQSY